MAGSKTDYLEAEVLKVMAGQTSIFGTAWAFWLALFQSSPGETSPGTAGEVGSGLGYARVPVGTASFFSAAPSGGSVVNTATANFGTSTASWGTVTHVGAMNSSTLGGGTCFWYADLTTPVIIASAGISFQFDATTNKITITEA